ncbi:MAG: hypothetical protein AB1938_24280 [Myxococcota bacterium]
MKVRIVGFLAVALLAGCGVGADESYDEPGVGRSEQGIEQSAPSDKPMPGTQTSETTTPAPGRDPGTVALPQDPIPVFVNNPMPPGAAMTTDPGLEGAPPPVLPTGQPPLPPPL